MKLNLRIALTVLSGIGLAALLSGCTIPTTKEDIANSATEYNLVAEKAGNEMLLLNIVRASKRRPMYFTSFGKLTRNMSFEVGTGSITVPFDRFADGSISPTAKYTNSPLFDLGVLDTQEFTRGIMTPVPMTTIEYYWSQGWHREMLLHLFIRRIDIISPKDPNEPVKVYLNYPGDPDHFPDFQEQIQTKNWEWRIEEAKATSIGEVAADEASQLKNLIKMQEAGLKLRCTKEKDKMELCPSQPRYVFTREATKKYREEKTDEMGKMPEKERELWQNMLKIRTVDTTDSPKKDGEWQIKVYLRSPEAILYYLGEILRVEIRGEDRGKTDPNANAPKIRAGIGEECGAIDNRLFYARKARAEDVRPAVSVDYEGTTYVVPETLDTYEGCCTDRSMHVLSLVSLLIGQQKKSEEVPATATVSVIGR